MTDLAEPSSSITEASFDDALSQRYLVYALSTITARSLPDVRDGLKPVHRRLLWAMRLLRLDPTAGYKKCARVVGDVIGKYHPHGDQSVYDAMVRLAQTFSLRYPLVDGQGNFGNVDGDNAAAMRYTEARLTAAAGDLMAGLDEGAVDYRPTYNGEEEEPEIFPGLFPNLLANGASGIAVGMAIAGKLDKEDFSQFRIQDEKIKDDHEKRIRRLERWVLLGLGALGIVEFGIQLYTSYFHK